MTSNKKGTMMKMTGKTIRRILIRSLIGFTIVLCAGCSITSLLLQRNLKQGGYMETWSQDDGRVLTGLAYGKGALNRYDLYLPKDLDPKADAPLLLFIHGGSWTEGQRGDMAYACKYYSKHGCITATMDYSLVSDKAPDVTVKTMLDEITACTAALKKRLAKEGYHTPKLAVGGFSAGGHLALLYAYSRASESAIPLAFVFDKVGPVSFHKEFWGADISAVLIGYGAHIQVDPKKLDAPETVAAADSLSPLHFVGPDSPPTIFAYGGKDDLVKPIHRDELAKALEAHHVPNIRVDFPHSNHAMWDDPDSTESFRKAVLQYCETYMKPKKDDPEPNKKESEQDKKESEPEKQ